MGQPVARRTLRRLRRLLRTGAPIPPDLLPDAVLLETLANGVIRARQTRWLPCATPFVAAPVLFGVAAISLEVAAFLLMTGACAYFLWLVARVAAPTSRSADRAMTHIRLALLARATTEMVPTLLRLRYYAADTYTQDAIDEALLPLLRDFRDADRLTARERAALRQIVQHENARGTSVAIAALLLLGDARDGAMQRKARRWAQRHPDERFRETAAEYLTLTGKARS